MKILLLILIGIFVVVNVGVKFLRKDLNTRTDPMSSYLVGKFGIVVDASYGALALALALLPLYAAGAWFAIFCWLAAVALCGVVLTARARVNATGELNALLLHVHVTCAGIAFIAATVALLNYSMHHHQAILLGLLSLLAPISAWFFSRFAPKATAIEENTYAAILVAGLIALVLVP